MKLTPLVFDMLVNSLELSQSFPAAAAGFLSSADFSLYPAKLRLCRLVMPGIFDRCPIAENGKA
jgi:hypothetical protein